MLENLQARIEKLRQEIDAADGEARDELIEHLDQAVMGLEGVGVEVPAWAHDLLNKVHEQEVEEGFDNLPV